MTAIANLALLLTPIWVMLVWVVVEEVVGVENE